MSNKPKTNHPITRPVSLSDFTEQLGKVRMPERSRNAHAQSWSMIADRIDSETGQRQAKDGRSKWNPVNWYWSFGLAAAGMAAAIIVVVVLSQNSLPGDITYGVKRAIETAQIDLTLSDAKKADACSMQMKRRANELARLSDNQLQTTTVHDLSQSILSETAEFKEYAQSSGSNAKHLQDQRQRDIAYVVEALQSAYRHTQDKQQQSIITHTIRTLRDNA